jgi:hypothetical protein
MAIQSTVTREPRDRYMTEVKKQIARGLDYELRLMADERGERACQLGPAFESCTQMREPGRLAP